MLCTYINMGKLEGFFLCYLYVITLVYTIRALHFIILFAIVFRRPVLCVHVRLFAPHIQRVRPLREHVVLKLLISVINTIIYTLHTLMRHIVKGVFFLGTNYCIYVFFILFVTTRKLHVFNTNCSFYFSLYFYVQKCSENAYFCRQI